ncbi:GLPGLI family protein [Flavobacterium croceum DSM 17960]|uniref:GLPGLI family protein n=1 Tax=Flavobacterium croceum DSM 17960 TaxID=1121886 RepID=A0A2S4NA74_9FLAO|nr:GLPGLI family protein [Flavobacterium croceum]POS02588.1 GLPGLI family protein [Flavobacterium croceum DSM 17960]
MKQLPILLILLLFVSGITFAQKDFQGMAVYESKTSTSEFKSRLQGNKDITPEMQKMIEERMKKMFEKTYILHFNMQSSIYKEEEKLDTPGQQQGGFRMMSNMMGAGGTYYKNIKDKKYTVDREFMGKEFLVKDTLTNYKWQMSGETREIGGYMCYKATAVVPVSKTDFKNFRLKKEDTKEKEKSTEETTKKTSFLDEVDIPKEITLTAWYTTEIPVSQGPEGYWGLPGLILEVNDGRTTILCSKLVMNPKEKADIKAPTNGKEISQKDYDETVLKKMEEFREMNQGQGGKRMEIRMGR